MPTTNTIFDSHRIAISEWIEYCLNLFRYVSVNADSWNNRNAFTTSVYWLQKLFLTLENIQDDIVLSDAVWLDETFYPVIQSNIKKNAEGNKLHGLSENQICIGVATDKVRVICIEEGLRKPSAQTTYETFKNHITPGAILIHDGDNAHQQLIEALKLRSQVYLTKETKGLSDKQNPLDPVNDVHDKLKKFLNAHSGFNRKHLQGYLNLYVFATNPPHDPLEKVEKILNLAFSTPKRLRYRDQFGEGEVEEDILDW